MSFKGFEQSIDDKCHKILKRVGIVELAHAMPTELSGGKLIRLCIARALINDLDFIFADEPTNDLDTQNSDSMLSLLREISHEGTGVVVVSHERNLVDFTDELYQMESGKLEYVNV